MNPGIFAAQHIDQFVSDDFDHLLARTQALQYILSDGLCSHGVSELLDDFEIHVRFKQGDADFLQRFIDVLFGQAAFALQILECAL